MVSYLAQRKVRRDTLTILAAAHMLEQDSEAQEWGWLVDPNEDAIGQPLYVPLDVAELAASILNEETFAEEQRMQHEQWQWVLGPMAIRNAMQMAQNEPNIEMALLNWMAQQPIPDALGDDEDEG